LTPLKWHSEISDSSLILAIIAFFVFACKKKYLKFPTMRDFH
jgi:hypothetical protein